MTDMRKATSRVGAVFGTAALVAAASVAVTNATASADPAGHQVTYTLTTAAPYDFTLTYLVSSPPSKQAYNTDAYAYMKRETVNVSPDAPWIFTTTMTDPGWAFLQGSSTQHGGQGAPGASCQITVDGQAVANMADPYSPQCFPSPWAGA